LPSSTREAVIASPQFHQKKHETLSIQREASPHKVSKSAVTNSKEQWLKRYKGSYPGKRDSTRDNIEFLSISQVEPVDQSFIARDTALLAVESKVDKLKVPPIEKVQEWLQKNEDEFDKAPAVSSESNTVTFTADVHRCLEEEPDLVSVSQQQFYVAPRRADVGALRNTSEKHQDTYDKVKQASNEKRIHTSRAGNENNTKPCEKVREGQNVEDDPYEFISSQTTGTLAKKKMKTEKKCEAADQKTYVKNFKICDPPSKRGDNKNPSEKNTLSCNSPPVSDFTFVCPVEINDTFDNLVANTIKPEPTKTVKMDAIKVVAGDDNSDDIGLFRTPLEVPATSQNNGGSTTESMSDADFSSGSSEEWGESNQVKCDAMHVDSRRTRSSSYNLPAKKSPTRSTCRLTAGKKSSGVCSRRSEKLNILSSTSKEASKRKLRVKNPVKPKPLSPVKKVNPNTNVDNFSTINMKQHPAVCSDSDKKSEQESVACLSTDKTHPDKENVICPVNVKYGAENKINLEHTATNTTACLRSPGWSRISQSRKDFERYKKPALNTLNVSGGEVCTSKKHVTSVSEVPTKTDIINEVMSPLPSIDDADSSFGIPVVAFNSPEASNRVQMMSRIVMDLESQMELNSSTRDIAEMTTESCTPHTTKDWTLKKNISLGSDAFSEPMNALDSPMSCQRKELIHAVLSSLENDDGLEHTCYESNEQIVSGITKLSGGERAYQEKDKKNYDTVNNSVVDTIGTVFIVQESNSTMAQGETAENTEHNQDNHNKDDGNIKNNMVEDNSETLFIVQESNSSMAHEEVTENTEHNQDNHNRDNSIMKNNPVVDSSETVLMVQDSNITITHEEATKNIKHNQDDHIKGHSNIMKKMVVDMSRNNKLMAQRSCSTMAHEVATENTEHNQDNHNKDNSIMKNNPVVDSSETVLMVQESNITITHEEATKNIKHNQDDHIKGHSNIMKKMVVDMSRNNKLMVQRSCSTMAHEVATENTEHNQDNHNKDKSIMNNPVVDNSETLFIVQESNSTMAHEESTENTEHNQDNHNKGHSNIMKNLVVDMSWNNKLMVRRSCSTKRHEVATENTEYDQDSHNKDNGNFMNNHVFEIGKKHVVVCQEAHSIAACDKDVENIQQNPMVVQNMIPTDRVCMKMNRSLKSVTECGQSPSPEYLNNQTEKSVEAVHNGNINTEQFPANSSLAASSEDLQARILSEKCSQERLAVLSSDMIINSKAQENSFFRPCSTNEPQLQPQKMSTDPVEIKTENFHESEVWSSCNSSVGLVNSYPNRMHIPFIKCGRLTSSKLFIKFVLLGSLAPRRNNVSPETLQDLSSADSLGVQSGLLGREPLRMNCETGTQTSPGLLDAKINPTQENLKFVQFTTPTGTINHTQGHSEDFVPDSCGGIYAFPCAVPLPHFSRVQQTLVDSNKCMKDKSAEDDVNMNRTAMLRNQCEYSDPVDYMDHKISTSQFSMAKTVKVQQSSISDKGGHSPELPSNPMTHSGLNAPTLQETNTGKSLSSNQDKCGTCTSQKAVSDIQYGQPHNEVRNAKSHQQNEMFIPKTDGFAEKFTEVLYSKNSEHTQNNYGNTSRQKSSKRSSRASRQLTFSPDFIPKLSDPNLDVNTEDGESNVQKLYKKSYKRIRVVPTSSDSVSAGSDSTMSDAGNREIKKPCHISLRKASGNCKDGEVLVSKQDAETSPEVINLVTESSSSHSFPEVDDKTNNERKWLEEDVPDSEELMARVMANIEADLVEVKKRKMSEGNDRQEIRRESPTLFTPPQFVADSEEIGSRITCELLVSDSEAEREKMPHKKSFLHNSAVGNESDSLSTQQRNKIQVSIY